MTQEDVDRFVKKGAVAALDQHGQLAKLAVEETGRGVFEDKAVKNIFACEHVTNSMANLRTVGVINVDDLNGITEIAEPVGVIAGITPVTNPTSTAIFKALISLKTRNPIIFAFHPNAQQCSVAAARIVRDAAVAAGAPEHCIQWVEAPSLAATGALMACSRDSDSPTVAISGTVKMFAEMPRSASGATASPRACDIAIRPCVAATDASGRTPVQSPAA